MTFYLRQRTWMNFKFSTKGVGVTIGAMRLLGSCALISWYLRWGVLRSPSPEKCIAGGGVTQRHPGWCTLGRAESDLENRGKERERERKRERERERGNLQQSRHVSQDSARTPSSECTGCALVWTRVAIVCNACAHAAHGPGRNQWQ